MVSGISATISSVIAGTAGLTKAGLGTLILTGANTYTGGTTISAGTLQIGNGATGSVVGDIVDNAALVFNRTGTLTYAGVISGTGSVTKSGTATLTLTGNSTYTGGTTINAGTFVVSTDANLGAASGGLSFGGGTLQSTASFTSNRNVTLIGAGTFNTNAATTLTLGGAITGSGSLTKSGTGTLTLTGTSTYTGTTTISAGTLQAGATNAFSSASAHTVTSVLDLSGFNQTIGSLAGAGTVTNAGGGRRDPHHRRQQHVDNVLRRHPGWRGSDRPDQSRHRHIHADGRQHLYRRHDDQRRDAADRQWRHHRQHRRRHRQQRRARLQPHRHADLCRRDQRHRLADQERDGHADADRRQHLHRRHDDQRRNAA